MSKHWIKMHMDLLDDPKTSRFPDWLFRRFVLFLLAAGEYGKDGLLQPVDELAWRLRLSDEKVEEALSVLEKEKLIKKLDSGVWRIIGFGKYQYSRQIAGWKKIRIQILERDKYICAYCGKEASHIDHIIPYQRSADNDASNLVSACRNCNQKKHAYTPEELGWEMLFDPRKEDKRVV